jgi:hypothetical protein
MSLSVAARHQSYLDLGRSLPLTGAREDHERRHETAIEAFDALSPADAWEASLAVQTVLTAIHAVECMHEAKHYQDDFAKVSRCKAQFASLMRESRAARRMLWQEQKGRLGVERVADGVAVQPQAAAAEPVRAEAEQAAALPPARVAEPVPPPRAGAPPQPSAEALAAARGFMRQHSAAAARIRADGGITQKCRARWQAVLPTDPGVVEALIRTPRKLLIAADAAEDVLLDVAA